MRTPTRHLLPFAGAALGLLVAAVAPRAAAQPYTEGYDPLRQITAQIQKANLLIVEDVTGSFAWWPSSNSTPTRSENSFGYLVWGGASGGSCDKDHPSLCRTWDYKLTFEAPSRMATVKNVLGNSVALVTNYAPPAVSGRWSRTATSGSVDTKITWTFRYDYGSGNTGTAPGVPFTPYETITVPGTNPAFTVTNFPIVRDGACTVGTCSYSPPKDIVALNASRVNWGLMTYSTDLITTRVAIDTTDANKDLQKLVEYFVPKGAQGAVTGVSGLSASGSTNTRTVLNNQNAQKVILDAARADPKVINNCNRPYGVILVTDGLSNSANPKGGNWISPCTNMPCDGGSSGYDCPSSWTLFAADGANTLYTGTISNGVKIPVRTWTIGVSSAVGPCELDFIAYMGRTDANAPDGNAGFSPYDPDKPGPPPVKGNNPYIPDPNATDPTTNYDGPTGQEKFYKNTSLPYDPDNKTYTHGHNAFFATTADTIADAIAAIVNATATGDYATNAPVSGSAAALANLVFVPATGFPSWQGHFYAFDTSLDPTDGNYLNWEAGDVLKKETDTADRKIYTWDPANGNALVEVTVANLAKLQALAGTTAFDASVVDFVRGNDGSGSKRSWLLGPMINSSPALVASPQPWTQQTVTDHKAFQQTYKGRPALIWVGSNDGMLHAFRAAPKTPKNDEPLAGHEFIALIPPSVLNIQVTLFDNYKKDAKYPSGQPRDNADHIYGVANSLRFGDVYDPTTKDYRTIGFLTLGMGGSELYAIDITNVPPPNASPYPSDPVKVLWSKSSGASTLTQLPSLGESWSVPAVAPVSSTEWRLVMGSGQIRSNTAASQGTGVGFVTPRAYVLDPNDGSFESSSALTKLSSPAPLVGDQAFADSVFFDPKAGTYQEDNVASLGLQADLNGRIWYIYDSTAGTKTFDQAKVGIDVSTDVLPSQPQPLYYPPAASGYGVTGTGCVAYAFGSGTLYETSDKVTGPQIGTNPNFVPRIYIALNQKGTATTKIPAGNITAHDLNATFTWTDPTTKQPVSITLGKHTQMTAPPFILASTDPANTPNTALFLVYDPDLGCHGNSYVIVVDFDGDAGCKPANVKYTVYSAGEGAASGFTIAGKKVLVAKSGIGEGQRAGLYEPPNISAAIGKNPLPKVKWWKELK